MILDAKEILTQAQSAWTIRDLWRSVLQEAYDLAFPGVSPYVSDKKHPRAQNRLFDSTAVYSVIRLVNRLFNEITPPSGEMGKIESGPLLEVKLGPEGKDQIDGLNRELEHSNAIITMFFQAASFAAAFWAAWVDFVVAGMGCVLVLENPEDDLEPLIFEAVSQSEIAITEGAGSKISEVFRKRKIKVRMIKRLWNDATIPDDLPKSDEKDKDPEIDIIEVCYKNVDSGKDTNRGEWIYEVLWNRGDNPATLVSRDYNTCPYIIWRAMKIAGSPYGPGYVLTALSDIRTANKVKEMILKQAALALAGIYLAADDGVLNIDNVQITNGAIIPVQRTGGTMGASLAPLETGRNFDMSQLVIEELRGQIKGGLLDRQLPPLDGKVRSATEFIERQQALSEDIGGELPRIMADLVVPLYRRAIDVASRRGYIPPIKVDQFALKVTIKTPLARGEQMRDVERVVQWWQIISSVVGPEIALSTIPVERLLPWIAEQIGILPELYNTEAENESVKKTILQLAAEKVAVQMGATSQPQAA